MGSEESGAMADWASGAGMRALTIDGAESRDLDDAVWIEERDGGWLARVCITNVAAAVRHGTFLDVRARERGGTRYFKEQQAPMLPVWLSEGRLSLLPGEERGVVCVEVSLSGDLDVLRVDIRTGVVQSMAQLTYCEVAGIVHGVDAAESPEIETMLRQLAMLAERLQNKRRERSGLASADIDAGWVLNEEGVLVRPGPSEAGIAYAMVQEMMVLANRSMAERLRGAGAHALFHGRRARTVRAAESEIRSAVERVGSPSEPIATEVARNGAEENLMTPGFVFRASQYSAPGAKAYLHATSPLRRYSDLVNQRILLAVLADEPSPYSAEEVAAIGQELKGLAKTERARARRSKIRRKATAIASGSIEAEPGAVAELSGAEFTILLRNGAETEEATVGLAAALRARFERGLVTAKEVFWLLYECPTDAAWAALRRLALAWLRRYPNLAVSVLSEGRRHVRWSPVQYEHEENPSNWACRAALSIRNRLVQTDACYGATRAAAQQRAEATLCGLLLARRPVDLEAPVVGGAAESAAATEYSASARLPLDSSRMSLAESMDLRSESLLLARVEADRAAAAVIDAYRRAPVPAQIEAGDWTSAVCMICTRLGRKRPRFDFEPREVDGEPRVFCRAVLPWQDRTLAGDGEGDKPSSAKQQAARALLTVWCEECGA